MFEIIFLECLTKRLEGIFVPKLSQAAMNRMIIHEVIDASEKAGIIVYKIMIIETADHEYLLNVNHNIKIKFALQEGTIHHEN